MRSKNSGVFYPFDLIFRQSKNHKTRIIIFVGSPIDSDEKDLQRLAKKLKKEKVNVDIVNFGETEENTEKLTNFVSTLNGKEGTGTYLRTNSLCVYKY